MMLDMLLKQLFSSYDAPAISSWSIISKDVLGFIIGWQLDSHTSVCFLNAYGALSLEFMLRFIS